MGRVVRALIRIVSSVVGFWICAVALSGFVATQIQHPEFNWAFSLYVLAHLVVGTALVVASWFLTRDKTVGLTRSVL